MRCSSQGPKFRGVDGPAPGLALKLQMPGSNGPGIGLQTHKWSFVYVPYHRNNSPGGTGPFWPQPAHLLSVFYAVTTPTQGPV